MRANCTLNYILAINTALHAMLATAKTKKNKEASLSEYICSDTELRGGAL